MSGSNVVEDLFLGRSVVFGEDNGVVPGESCWEEGGGEVIGLGKLGTGDTIVEKRDGDTGGRRKRRHGGCKRRNGRSDGAGES